MQTQIVRDRTKWLLLSFAFLATVINYLDRQTLSVMAPVLLEEFHISAQRYSYIVSAFMLAYTLMNGVSGRLLDRLGTKAGYAWTMAWWSAAEMLCALAAGALSLGIFRFLLGMGEAGNHPAREAGRGMVSRGRAIARFRYLQQRLIDRSDSCSATTGMDPTDCRVENSISCRGCTRVHLAGGMDPLLPTTQGLGPGCNRPSPA